MRKQYAVTVAYQVEKQTLVYADNELEAEIVALRDIRAGGPYMVIGEKTMRIETHEAAKGAKTIIY
jgi:hypothetical protein